MDNCLLSHCSTNNDSVSCEFLDDCVLLLLMTAYFLTKNCRRGTLHGKLLTSSPGVKIYKFH